jgi:hypothetical protein
MPRNHLVKSFVILGLILYPVIIILYAFLGFDSLQFTALFIGLGLFLVMSLKSSYSLILGYVFIALVFVLMLFGFFSTFWTGMRNYGALFVFLSSIGVAWSSLEYKLSKYSFEYPFYLILIVTFWLIFLGYDKNSFNDLLAVGSRNVYSSILLAFAFGYLFSRYYRGFQSSILLAILVLLSSLFLYSRTGISLSFVFLSLVLYQRLKFRVSVFISSVFLIFAYVYIDDLLFIIESYSNFTKGVDSERYEIWHSYLSQLNGVDLFFGANLSENSYISNYFKGNPHSAYIRLHSYFGVGLFLLISIIFLSLYLSFRDKRFLFFIISVVFLFRAAFDPIYFIWIFDYLFYPALFYVFFKRYYARNSLNKGGFYK